MFVEVSINWWAVVVATAAAYGLGPIWYGQRLFAEEWSQLSGKTAQEIKQSAPTAYVVSLVCFFVVAYVLAHFIELIGAFTWQNGLLTGFWIGIGFIATSHLINNVFLGRSGRLYLIDVGYQVVAIMLMGAILGGWQ